MMCDSLDEMLAASTRERSGNDQDWSKAERIIEQYIRDYPFVEQLRQEPICDEPYIPAYLPESSEESLLQIERKNPIKDALATALCHASAIFVMLCILGSGYSIYGTMNADDNIKNQRPKHNTGQITSLMRAEEEQYICHGESLKTVSKRAYGTEKYWREIKRYNSGTRYGFSISGRRCDGKILLPVLDKRAIAKL